MQEITYESIAPLVRDVRPGSTLHVTFTCPVTGQAVQSSATMGLSQELSATVRRSVINNLIRSFSHWISRVLGHGFGGRIARDLINQGTRGASTNFQYSAADRQKAIVEAFGKVQSQFIRDAASGQWSHANARATSTAS